MVSHIEVRLPEELSTPNNIGKGLKVPQRKLRKESLFVHYDKEKNVSLLLAPIPIKSLTEGTNVICLLIYNISKEGDCSDSWQFFSRHCANGGSQIKGIDFYQ